MRPQGRSERLLKLSAPFALRRGIMDEEGVMLTLNVGRGVACDGLLYRLDSSVYSAGDTRHHSKGVRTIK